MVNNSYLYLDIYLLFIYQSCGMDKSFLFDVVSKIYVATDTNPVNMQTYELCSDMIDVVIDVSCIYGYLHKALSRSLYIYIYKYSYI